MENRSLTLFGITIVEHPLLKDGFLVPVKKHSKNKGSAKYHERIQKKWNKRFGQKTEHRCFVLPSAKEKTLYVPEHIITKLRGLSPRNPETLGVINGLL